MRKRAGSFGDASQGSNLEMYESVFVERWKGFEGVKSNVKLEKSVAIPKRNSKLDDVKCFVRNTK